MIIKIGLTFRWAFDRAKQRGRNVTHDTHKVLVGLVRLVLVGAHQGIDHIANGNLARRVLLAPSYPSGKTHATQLPRTSANRFSQAWIRW